MNPLKIVEYIAHREMPRWACGARMRPGQRGWCAEPIGPIVCRRKVCKGWLKDFILLHSPSA